MYATNQYVQTVELYRDGLDCPWGFRLKGGIDVEGGTPLEIIRVRHLSFFKDFFYKCKSRKTRYFWRQKVKNR